MVRALLVYPRFSTQFRTGNALRCALQNAALAEFPLGLLTVAALLPKHWHLTFLDANLKDIPTQSIREADLVFVGGMSNQRKWVNAFIDTVHAEGKKVVVGGPDATQHPNAYLKANYRILGEAEALIPKFANDFEMGTAQTLYESKVGANMECSPLPRFDLVSKEHYLKPFVQTSRGCPFLCEFCSSITLQGRVPRYKTQVQITSELDLLFELGFRGSVRFAEDNFIGNRQKAKENLKAVAAWQKTHGYPFHFTTMVSINIVDDPEMMQLLKESRLTSLFIGVEAFDEQILREMKKLQNTKRSLVKGVRALASHGVTVIGGIILGHDGETAATVRETAKFIDASLIFESLSLLSAHPGTALYTRLKGGAPSLGR